MTQDHSNDSKSTPARRAPGRLLIAGALGACVLGAGLGHWARPNAPGPSPGAKPAVRAAPSMKIVVAEDTQPPVGAPLEVLAPQPAPVREFWRPRPHPAPFPVLRVDAPASYPSLPPRRTAAPVELQTAEAPKASPKPFAKLVKAVKAEARELAHPKAPSEPKVAKATAKPKAERREFAKAKPTSKVTDKPVKLAKAEPRPPVVQKASIRKPSAPKPAVQKVEVRKTPSEAPRVEKAVFVKRPATAPPTAKAAASPKGEARAESPRRAPRPEPCASADPGAELVCSDRRLGARDRQLQQAYRNAEAAGVPEAALKRQQARWLQARAAAARDAPWAVEDVYVARISELNELARDAREN